MITPSDLEMFGMESYLKKATALRSLSYTERQKALEALVHEADDILIKQLISRGVMDGDRQLAYGRAMRLWLSESADVYYSTEDFEMVAEER